MSSGLRRGMILALGVAGVGALMVSACQRYEFEQVTPVAIKPVTKDEPVVGKTEKPYIMLVVDKSGSMKDAAAGGGQCVDAQGNYDRTKACKWNDLLTAFTDTTNGFLPVSKGKNLARFGLTVFPASTDGCDAGQVAVPLSPDADGIDTILAQLRNVNPAGGTPIATTLRNVAQDSRLKTAEPGRKRFVMLLTDGQPNCNPANEQRCRACVDLASCQRVPDGCWPTYGDTDKCDMFNAFVGAACLDDVHTVEAVRELRQQGVETFVIGFGLETAQGTKAAAILNRAAEEGGRARGNSDAKYYQAGTREELQKILEDISNSLQSCTMSISPEPTSANVLQIVMVDNTTGEETELVKNEDWSFSGGGLGTIEFLGARCTLIQNAPPDRYALQFRYVASM